MTKKEFKRLHAAGGLLLLGSTMGKTLAEVKNIVNATKDLESHALPTTGLGNISSSKDGTYISKLHEDGNIIYLMEEHKLARGTELLCTAYIKKEEKDA